MRESAFRSCCAFRRRGGRRQFFFRRLLSRRRGPARARLSFNRMGLEGPALFLGARAREKNTFTTFRRRISPLATRTRHFSVRKVFPF